MYTATDHNNLSYTVFLYTTRKHNINTYTRNAQLYEMFLLLLLLFFFKLEDYQRSNF